MLIIKNYKPYPKPSPSPKYYPNTHPHPNPSEGVKGRAWGRTEGTDEEHATFDLDFPLEGRLGLLQGGPRAGEARVALNIKNTSSKKN